MRRPFHGQARQPFLKQPDTPEQIVEEQPVGQEVADRAEVEAAAVDVDLTFGVGVACNVCVDGTLEDAAGATSPAQAGTTMKANNSNRFFMFFLSLINS